MKKELADSAKSHEYKDTSGSSKHDGILPDDPLYQYSDKFKKELKEMHKQGNRNAPPKADMVSRIGNQEIRKRRANKQNKSINDDLSNIFQTPPASI